MILKIRTINIHLERRSSRLLEVPRSGCFGAL